MNFLDDLQDESALDDDLYAILGVDETSDHLQIKTEFKYKAKKCHPDKAGADDKVAHKEFERVRWAYEILSDEASRASYDEWRGSGLAIPFKMWMRLNDAGRTSMHWVVKPKKKLMIEEAEHTATENESKDNSMKNCNTQRDDPEKDRQEEKRGSSSENNEAKPKQTIQGKRKVFKATLKGWGSSGMSNKFKKYEI